MFAESVVVVLPDILDQEQAVRELRLQFDIAGFVDVLRRYGRRLQCFGLCSAPMMTVWYGVSWVTVCQSYCTRSPVVIVAAGSPGEML